MADVLPIIIVGQLILKIIFLKMTGGILMRTSVIIPISRARAR